MTLSAGESNGEPSSRRTTDDGATKSRDACHALEYGTEGQQRSHCGSMIHSSRQIRSNSPGLVQKSGRNNRYIPRSRSPRPRSLFTARAIVRTLESHRSPIIRIRGHVRRLSHTAPASEAGRASKVGGAMPTRSGRIRAAIALVGGLALLTGSTGCSFGPKVLEKTHGHYNESIRRVYEEQLLENIIRCRYNESPFKLTVSSIAAQYELSGAAEARPFFVAPNSSNGIFKTFTSVLPDVNAGAANRPTITLIPSSGDGIRRFLTPIAPETLAYLGATCWPVSTVVRLYAERLNGVPNAPSASGPLRPFSPDFARFQRVAYLLQVAQDLNLGYITSEDRPTELGAPIAAAAITPAAAVEAAKNGLEYQPHRRRGIVGARSQGTQARSGAQPRRSRSSGLERARELAQPATRRADI